MGADVLEDLEVPALRHRPFERDAARLQEAVEAHHAEADRPLALGAVFCPRHFVGRALDIIGQHIVEEAHDVLDEQFVAVPLVPGFEVQRRQAAHRGAVGAEMVPARSAGDSEHRWTSTP